MSLVTLITDLGGEVADPTVSARSRERVPDSAHPTRRAALANEPVGELAWWNLCLDRAVQRIQQRRRQESARQNRRAKSDSDLRLF